MAFALGSFVDGLFSGAKSTMDLIETKRKMDDAQAVRDATEAARVKANADVEAESSAKTFTAALGNYGGGDDTAGTTGSSTPPTDIKEGVTGTRSPTARNAGAPELVDRIAPIVSKHESSDRPYVGYGGVDLSKAPAKSGFFGFPDWAGVKMPDGTETHAAGLFGFQPDTWKQYAGPLGVTDFSPESQRKVFNAAYLAEGLRPWARNRAVIGDAAAAGLLGGAGAQKASTPTGQPTALNRDPGTAPITPSAPPDMEGQRTKAQPGPASNTASTVLKTILSGGTTPAQQANVPEGNTTLPAQSPFNPFMTPALSPPSRSVSSAAVAADPVATAAATSALSPTPAATPSSPAPITVTPPPQRPVLSELRRSSDYPVSGRSESSGYGNPPVPGSGFMGRQTPIGGMPPQRSIRPDEKIIRLPDGTMVDGIGNVVRQAPSALFPR